MALKTQNYTYVQLRNLIVRNRLQDLRQLVCGGMYMSSTTNCANSVTGENSTHLTPTGTSVQGRSDTFDWEDVLRSLRFREIPWSRKLHHPHV